MIDDRDVRVERWECGVDLSLAWLHFGDERQLRLQRETAGTSASIVYEKLMMGGVFSDLASGRRRAMGYQVAPSTSDGPIPIPRDVFYASQGDLWASNRASGSGDTYERVKVVLAPEQPEAAGHSIPASTAPGQTASKSAPRKRGPKPLDPYIERAITSLLEEKDFLGASQESQIRAIIARAEKQNPVRFKAKGPSHSSVWRYLQAHPLPST